MGPRIHQRRNHPYPHADPVAGAAGGGGVRPHKSTYALTELGHGAYRALRPLVRWSAEWAATLSAAGPEDVG
jgi:hypothetical protein